MKKTLQLFLLKTPLLTACNAFDPDHYDVFIYPDRRDLTKHIYAGRYESESIARAIALDYVKEYPDGDYEIGKNCKSNGICEDTSR